MIFVKRFYGSRRVDRQTMKIYIYIRSILGPSKNSKRSIISLASGSTGLFYFLANDPVSGRVQNLETVTESKPPIFVLWWRREEIPSPVPPSFKEINRE